MEKRSSLNGRFSLSTSNLSGAAEPESTHISHIQQRFPWGDGALNSSEKYIANDIIKRTTIIAKAGLRQKNDPRTFTDIQSKGLASRIVKYHGNNSRLNSSLSMNNLYNKPGQFPVVHLKKQKEISYNLNKKNLSMVRIAPPEKSVFQANTRSSILRTGSIVATIGFQKCGDEVSRENRPILHPAVENETAPTRSVLDDLKEISRKRINSDVLDSNDSLKKYCKELEVSPTTSPIIQQTSVVPSKRQRENPLLTAGAQRSPEQIGIKRRMYSNINNDITSSLSSSLNILSPKQKCPVTNTKMSTPDLELQSQDTQRLNQTPTSIKSNTSLNLEQNSPLSVDTTADNISSRSGEVSKSISEPLLWSKTNNKPKLTLFNKNYETAPPKEYVKNGTNYSKEESSGICFVKPKPNTADSNNIGLSENSLILRTQKSKLALMLSGLSGDLNMNSEDGTDSVSKFDKEPEEYSNQKSVTSDSLPTLNSSQTTLSFGTSTTVATKIISSPTTANINVDKIVEKSLLPEKDSLLPEKELSRDVPTISQNTINSNNIVVTSTNIVKTAETTKSVGSAIYNKNEIGLNYHSGTDSLTKFQTNFAIDKATELSIATTSPIRKMFGSDNVSALPKTSLNDQHLNTAFTPAVGIKNKLTVVTNASECNVTLNNNSGAQSNLSEQKNMSIIPHLYSNSNVKNNEFEQNPKTTSYFSTSFNFNTANSSNIFDSKFPAKPSASNKELNQIVFQNTFTNQKTSDAVNSLPIAPAQNFFTLPGNSIKNDSNITFRPVNNNSSFTKFVTNDNLGTVKPIGSDLEKKSLPMQSSGNEFLAPNLNTSEGGFCFKPVGNGTQQIDNKNNLESSNIPSIFGFGSNSKEGVLSLGSKVASNFSFGGPNAQLDTNKGISFDDNKRIPGGFSIPSSKTELSKNATFSFGNNVTTANQFSVGTKSQTETFSPFSFRGNDSQTVNSTLGNREVVKPFSFSSNTNTNKEAMDNGGQNISTDVYKSEITAKPTITNAYSPVSSGTNERLIRKATRRLHK